MVKPHLSMLANLFYNVVKLVLTFFLKLRMFPLPLFGTAFTWFTSLAHHSIFTWTQLEQKFHEYFHSEDTKLRLSHLTTIKQKYNEHVTDYIR
jgi:hypothetical protein